MLAFVARRGPAPAPARRACGVAAVALVAGGCLATVVGDQEDYPEPDAVCGDGIVQLPEECDRGARNGTGVGCSPNCRIAEDDCAPNHARQCITPLKVLECVDRYWRLV